MLCNNDTWPQRLKISIHFHSGELACVQQENDTDVDYLNHLMEIYSKQRSLDGPVAGWRNASAQSDDLCFVAGACGITETERCFYHSNWIH